MFKLCTEVYLILVDISLNIVAEALVSNFKC